MRLIFFTTIMLVMTACSTQQVGHSEKRIEFHYPEETEHFVAKDLKVYDDPLLGSGLAWLDKAYRHDVITQYVYPIRDTEWEDTQAVLTEEMQRVMQEVQYSVEQGSYQEVSEPTIEPFEFEQAGKLFTGLRSTFEIRSNKDVVYNSNAYLFLAQDKYIKFRTSFDSRVTPDWNGDRIVQEILPLIQVEPESAYLRELRDRQREAEEAQMQALLKQLIKAAASAKEGEPLTIELP